MDNIIVIVIIIIVIVLALLVIVYWRRDVLGSKERQIQGGGAKREIEARFLDIDVDDIRKKLKKLGAKREYKATRLYRTVYALESEGHHGYSRIRVEPRHGKSRVVLTSKVYPATNEKVTKSAEKVAPIETEVTLSHGDSYEDARAFMKSLGLREKTEAEQYREEWRLEDRECVIDIDWLPGLAPSLEIECSSDAEVRASAMDLGLDYESAVFGSYAAAYSRVYGFSQDVINNQIPELKFASVTRILDPYVHDEHARAKFAHACKVELPDK